ncbi:MAG: DUF3604 domain-containing protein [Candidatus Lokiarchaeota archaeon]|nr:DUF3604 domain-containing protein [Candidatus Lokiarchaeota archaeon]
MDSKTKNERPEEIPWLKIIRIAVFLVGFGFILPFFFNIIAIIIGLVYFFAFKGAWRRHGFILVSVTALATFPPQMGFVEVTGIYPLKMVALFGYALGAGYLFSLLIIRLLSKNPKFLSFRQNFESTIDEKLNLKNPLKGIALIAIITLPSWMYFAVSIDFGVMFNNDPKMLWIHTPSTADPGSQFDVTVEAWDSYERVSAVYDGTVSFSLKSYDLNTLVELGSATADLPVDYTFTAHYKGSEAAYRINDGRDNGMHTFDVTIDTPGIHYLVVDDTKTGHTYYSNPIVVQNGDLDIYWGDLHSHSLYSDGAGKAEHNYGYARDVALIDFFSLTDHGKLVDFKPWILDTYVNIAEEYNVDDEFVTFLGMEYTNHKTGHFSCIFSGDQLCRKPIVSAWRQKTPFELWDLLDDFTATTGDDVIALPHHCVKERYMQDWTYYNPKYVKIAEVTSTHGDNLYDPSHPLSYRGATIPSTIAPNGSSLTDAISMGCNFTLYASSDGHDGHPGHTLSHTPARISHQYPRSQWWTRIDKPYPGGITAVYSSSLTRSEIFTQLQNGACFASSDFGRCILNFTINGIGMWDNKEINVATSTSDRNIEVIVAQDGAPASKLNTPATVTDSWTVDWTGKVEILKNGELLQSFDITNPVERITHTDNEPITGATYGSEKGVEIDGEYYINALSDNPVEDPNSLTTNGRDFYIIRLVQNSGRHSYVGPIYVST